MRPGPGDISEEAHCRAIIDRAVEEFGKVDILVNNAAFQMTREDIDEISTEEFDRTLKTNLYAMFWLTRAAVPHMPAGGR
jgi:NAD(P)-dependent dehydrogenase (short-subunit alcohol dehydrogenase family)